MTGRRIVVLALTIALGLVSVLVFELVHSMDAQQLPNNLPHPNPGGKAATFSTQGAVGLTGEFFQAQGTNGRSCASCHIAEDAWSINPGTLQNLFDETGGTHPVFNLLDANNPNMDVYGCHPERALATKGTKKNTKRHKSIIEGISLNTSSDSPSAMLFVPFCVLLCAFCG